jgi:triosephosphate isomerase
MAKRLFIGTHAKNRGGVAQTNDFLTQLYMYTQGIPRAEMCLFVISPLAAFSSVRGTVLRESVLLGVDDIGWEYEGRRIGENPAMLKEIGVDIIETGGSERRNAFFETLHGADEIVNKKVLAALSHGFTAILCVGIAQKDADSAGKKLAMQLTKGLRGVSTDAAKNLWIAYEPARDAGQDLPALQDDAAEKHGILRATL